MLTGRGTRGRVYMACTTLRWCRGQEEEGEVEGNGGEKKGK